MFYKNEEIASKQLTEGVERKILGYHDSLMVCEFKLKAGAILDAHSHPHEQITYLVSGRCIATLEDKTCELKAGDGMVIPSNAVHGITVLEDLVAIDSFSPMRKDFLE